VSTAQLLDLFSSFLLGEFSAAFLSLRVLLFSVVLESTQV